MKNLLFAATLLTLAGCAVPLNAGETNYFSAEQMAAFCQQDMTSQQSYCIGYLRGVAETLRYLDYAERAMDGLDSSYNMTCGMESANNKKLAKVFVNGMKRYPEYARFETAGTAIEIFMEKWPCD